MAIKYIKPVPAHAADELVALTYDQIQRDFGALVEPFTLHSPMPRLLAGVWMACRETLVVGHVRRDYKEAVATTISRINRCPYCVDAHTIMLYALDTRAAAAIERPETLSDPALRAIIEWAAALHPRNATTLQTPPFTAADAPEIIGTALIFHYINRMVSVLLDDTPLPLNNRWLRAPLKRVAGWMFAQAAHRAKLPGSSLDLLPEAPLPSDLAWAASSPYVAGALARFAAVVDRFGEAVLPIEVRDLVRERLHDWDGSDPGLSRQWVKEAIRHLDARSQTAGHLALLTAFAPYQIGAGVVEAFAVHFPGEGQLLAALAWASLTTARSIVAERTLATHMPAARQSE